MALFMEQPDQRPGLGSSLAQGVQGLFGGIAEGQQQQMQRANLERSLQGYNIDPKMAQAIAGVQDPKLQQLLLKEAIEAPYNEALAKMMGGFNGMPSDGMQPSTGQPGMGMQPGAPGGGMPGKIRHKDAMQMQQMRMAQEANDLKRQKANQDREVQFEKIPSIAKVRSNAALIPEIKPHLKNAFDALGKTSLTGPLLGKFSFASGEGQRLKAALDNIALGKFNVMLPPGSKGSIALLQLVQKSKASTPMNAKTIRGLLKDIQEDIQRYGYQNEAINYAIDNGYSPSQANSFMNNVVKASSKLEESPPDQYEPGSVIDVGRGFIFELVDDEWVFRSKEESE